MEILEIKGENVFNSSKLIFIEDLIYFDGPILSLYCSDDGEPYMFYWVDSDNFVNRWLVFNISHYFLQEFINGKLDLRSVFESVFKFYIVEIDDLLEHEVKGFIWKNQVPECYKPNAFIFDNTHAISYDTICRSHQYHTGILEMKFTGENVKYGRIRLNSFVDILTLANDFQKEVVTKKISKILPKRNNNAKSIKVELYKNWGYEYIESKAASFRIVLMPTQIPQMEIDCVETINEQLSQSIFPILESGLTPEGVRKTLGEFGKDTLIKYNNLLFELQKSNINLSFSWYNNNSLENKFTLDECSKQTIICNLDDVESESEEGVEYYGKFEMVNIRNNSYSFISNESIYTNGKFDESVKSMVYSITFQNSYKIIINRNIIDSKNKKKKTADTIVSFELWDDD